MQGSPRVGRPLAERTSAREESSDLGYRDALIIVVVTALIVSLIVVFLGSAPTFASSSEPNPTPTPEELDNDHRQ